MASPMLRRTRTEGSGEDKRDEELPLNFTCSSYKEWVVVTETRKEEDHKIKPDKWPWYQGRMNRSVAEDSLSKSAKFDGTFIIRESDAISVKQDPVYVISVLKDGVPHHVEVDRRSDGKYVLANVAGAKTFKSLKKLVDYYNGKPLDLEGGGHTKLKYTIED